MANRKMILVVATALVVGIMIGWLLLPNGHSNQTVGQELPAEHNHDAMQIWTCSMHPQIRQPDPGQCPICGMDLIPVASEAGNNDPLTLRMSARAVAISNIQTVSVQLENTEKSITLNGRIAVDERRVITQTAHFPGRIEKLFVNFTGEYVEAGQQIASIYSPELLTAQEELLEAKRFMATNPQLVEAARTKLKQWKLTPNQIQRIEESGQVQESFPILADRSGVVIKKHVNYGDHLMLGEPLYEIADLSKVWALFDAYENDLQWLNKGDRVTLSVKSLPGRTFSANISFIDPIINEQTRVATIRAELNNPEGLLKPEMFITGTLESDLAVEGKQIIIPKSAVLWTGPRSIVYVKLQDVDAPSFQLREITLGASLGHSYAVKDGLSVGEEIVVEGAYTIDAASELADKPSMMNQAPREKEGPFGEVPDYTAAASSDFLLQMQAVNRHYLDMQRALVKANDEAARAEAQALLIALPPKRSFEDPIAQSYWKGRYAGIRQYTQQITSAKTIDRKRKAFVSLSLETARTNIAFGTNEVLYIVYCPMANDDEGAYWLSDVEEVLNPYYGDMMLQCGTVEDQINP